MAQAIEKLGETEAAPGYLLLKLLSLQGWRISVMAHDDGVLVTASKLGFRTVEVSGASVADIATVVVAEANRESYERLH